LFWFVEDPARLAREKEAIDGLEDDREWLRDVGWGFHGGGLCLDAKIAAHGHDYRVRMTYPEVFPAAPPAVRPENREESWSGHQYRDGTLCLEWGPDNWHPEVTGAQMLESAHRLLSTENPRGEGPLLRVSSRHRLSAGQELRGERLRSYVSADLAAYLRELPEGAYGSFETHLRDPGDAFVALVRRMRPSGAPEWEDRSVPDALYGSNDALGSRVGVFYKTGAGPEAFVGVKSVTGLEEALANAGLADARLAGLAEPYPVGLEEPPRAALLVDSEDEPHLFLFLDGDGVLKSVPVRSEGEGPNLRLPEMTTQLTGKTVGIVGAGSVGVKLAASLARSGVRGFYVVDDDVVLPENLVRNDLDWRDVGEHKALAAKRRLELLAPGVEVRDEVLRLAGQENNASVARVLKRLGDCDLIVDATADHRVFNLLAHVAGRYSKPLVWMEVYGGGVGGMVARSRPGIDAEPWRMRAAYHAATADAPGPGPNGDDSEPYAAEVAEGKTLVASDAAVSIIAGYAASMALDALMDPAGSAYPHPVYLVGLSEGWMFGQPFHNIPITAPDPSGSEDSGPEAGSEAESEAKSEGLRFLQELLESETGARTGAP
jgi:hypothetical protein